MAQTFALPQVQMVCFPCGCSHTVQYGMPLCKPVVSGDGRALYLTVEVGRPGAAGAGAGGGAVSVLLAVAA